MSTPRIDRAERNYILNGDMRLAQRGTSFVAIANGAFSADRWGYYKVGTMVHTVSQDTDVPTFAESGYFFQNSLRLNLTTADTSMAATDYCLIQQRIEGFNWANLAQKPFVISFWVKATLAGVYHIHLRNNGADRNLVSPFTIASSNVWQLISIPIPASPSGGNWNYTNAIGLLVGITIASGRTGTVAGWETTGATPDCFAAQVNGVNTGATDFRITGVSVTEGTTAPAVFMTAGKDRSTEMALCQRYYEITGIANETSLASGAQTGVGFAPFRVEKRATPTVNIEGNGTANSLRNQNNGATVTGVTYGPSVYGCEIRFSGAQTDNILYSGTIFADAEL